MWGVEQIYANVDPTVETHTSRTNLLQSSMYQQLCPTSGQQVPKPDHRDVQACTRTTRGPLLLVHAHNIVLVDGLASNDSPEGIALLQHAAQLLLLALHLHVPLLKLALQALLVTLHPQLQC